MVIEVKVSSKETIKPSSPTPPHLRRFNLSIIDQLTPSIYASKVLYYSMINNSSRGNQLDTIETISSNLKLSLSQTLSHFYPLAGRIKGNLYVECNDAGALYSEARVNCSLADFLNAPDLTALDNFVPLPPVPTVPEDEVVQLAFQVNVFSCGGIAIGVSKLHKLIDAVLLAAFMKRWASISSGRSYDNLEHSSRDYKEASLLFPPRSTLPTNASNWSFIPFSSNSRVGRYVFSPDSVLKLKAKASSEAVPNPTTVQALSAFILKRLMQADCARSCTSKSVLACHPVNIRSRMKPESPDYSIGNIVLRAYTHVHGIETKSETELAELLRKTFSEFDSNYVKRFQGNEGFIALQKWLEELGQLHANSVSNQYLITDWTKLGFYGLDFGWGGPVWVSLSGLTSAPIKNIAAFDQSTLKGGLEVWLILDEEALMTLEEDQEFLAYALINPSVVC